MSSIVVRGNIPLQGEVEISGAVNSALKLVIASIYTNEDVIIHNIPRVKSLEQELNILLALGGTYEWLSQNSLKINNSKLSEFIVPLNLGKNLMTSFLFAGPLLFRFGETQIPLPDGGPEKIEKFINSYISFGFEVNFDADYLYLRSDTSGAGRVEFKNVSQTATDNAILSSVFLNGESTIINISEEVEVSNLIDFLNSMGAEIIYENKKVLKISGVNHFKGTEFTCISEISEAVFFSILAVVTSGNIVIRNIDKKLLSSFVSFLNKIEVNFEFSSEDEIRVWSKEKTFPNFEVEISSFPGLTSSFAPFLVILALKCNGVSKIRDISYKDKYDFVYILNKYMAKIKLFETGKDFEPCEVVVNGPTNLTTLQIDLANPYFAPVLLMSALTIDSDVEIIHSELFDYSYENLLEKLKKIGAKISYE